MEKVESSSNIWPRASASNASSSASELQPEGRDAIDHSRASPPSLTSFSETLLIPRQSGSEIETLGSSRAPRQAQMMAGPTDQAGLNFLDMPRGVHQEIAERLPMDALVAMQQVHRSLSRPGGAFRSEILVLRRLMGRVSDAASNLTSPSDWRSQMESLGLQKPVSDGDALQRHLDVNRLHPLFRANAIAELIWMLADQLRYGQERWSTSLAECRPLIRQTISSIGAEYRDRALVAYVYHLAGVLSNPVAALDVEQARQTVSEVCDLIDELPLDRRDLSLKMALGLSLYAIRHRGAAAAFEHWIRQANEAPDAMKRMELLQVACQTWRYQGRSYDAAGQQWHRLASLLIQSLMETILQCPPHERGAALEKALMSDPRLGELTMYPTLWDAWRDLAQDQMPSLVEQIQQMPHGAPQTTLLREVVVRWGQHLPPSSWEAVAEMIMQASVAERARLLASLSANWASMAATQRQTLHEASRRAMAATASVLPSWQRLDQTVEADLTARMRTAGAQLRHEPEVQARISQWQAWVDAVTDAHRLSVPARVSLSIHLLSGLSGGSGGRGGGSTSASTSSVYPPTDLALVQQVSSAWQYLIALLPMSMRVQELESLAKQLHTTLRSELHPDYVAMAVQGLIPQLPVLLAGRPSVEIERLESALIGNHPPSAHSGVRARHRSSNVLRRIAHDALGRMGLRDTRNAEN